MQDGESLTQHVPRWTMISPSKRHWVMLLEMLESGSDTVKIQKTLKVSQEEQAMWAIAHTLEQLVREQTGI